MPRPTFSVLAVLAALVPSPARADYLRDVKPLLAARCFACHGALQEKGNLRLDTAAAIRAGGKNGPAVTPKDAAASLLLAHVTAADGKRLMPPPGEGERLTAAEVARLKAWIEQGATGPAEEQPEPDPKDHWAFRPPARPPLPVVRDPSRVRNPIDAFLAAAREKHGLALQKPADRRVLLRRLYLDLVGLPPTRDELEAFANSPTPDADYERIVERLLASPAHGERWGRHWMDVWRYSDWWGLGAEVRNSQKHLWHWRDWVVESLNADTGYDQMAREMLAADELYPDDLGRLRATGFLARQYFKFNRNTWLEETVEHTGKAFLGLTLNCAKCHDHKYDPISQQDYYRFRAFFEPYQVRTEMVPGQADFEKDGIPRAFDCNLDAPTYRFLRGDEKQPITDRPLRPGLPALLSFGDLTITPVDLPPAAHSPGLRPHVLEAYLAQAKGQPAAEAAVRARAAAQLAPDDKALARAAAVAEKELAVARADEALAKTEAELAKAEPAKKADAEKKRDAARTALETARKALAAPGDTFTPLRGALKTVESTTETEAQRNRPFPTTSTGRRTALAAWMTDRRHPLTARVAVNHVWLRHFGRPLVPTVFDFGRKGTGPTHPELLDWLAVEFVESGWSLKHLHRLMVLSEAYRLSSSSAGSPSAALDAGNRHHWRMNPTRMDAPTLRDSLLLLAGELDAKMGGPSIPVGDEASRRRSLYFVHSHNDHQKFLSIFDDANVLECYRRAESILPQQALALSNSKFALAMAGKVNARLAAVPDAEFVRVAFETVLATMPTEEEKAACEQALAELAALFKGQPDATRRAREGLLQALVNHNDYITIR